MNEPEGLYDYLDLIRKHYLEPGGIERIQALSGLPPRRIYEYAKRYFGFTRDIMRWGYVMKMPQEYLEKYESTRLCEKCKGPILQGQEVRITKKRISGQECYIGHHISCPPKKGGA
jgi:hypothetical protein